MVKERYNIEKSKDYGEIADKVTSNISKARDGISKGMRVGQALADEWDNGMANINDFIWGSSRQRDDRREKYHSEERQRVSGNRYATGGSKNKYVIYSISHERLSEIIEQAGIDPASVPQKFYEELATEFGRQVEHGLEPFLEEKVGIIVKDLDREYTRRYGRK